MSDPAARLDKLPSETGIPTYVKQGTQLKSSTGQVFTVGRITGNPRKYMLYQNIRVGAAKEPILFESVHTFSVAEFVNMNLKVLVQPATSFD